MLLSNLRQRLARDEGGFTLIELLVVLIIIAVLLAIAVPSYLGFKDKAEERAAKSNVRAAIPAVEAHYSDAGTYADMKLADLKLQDQAINLTVEPSNTGASDYCIQNTQGKFTAWKRGPGGTIQVRKAGSDAPAVCTAG